MNHLSLKQLATETLRIVESGAYPAPSGRSVEIGPEVRAAVERTVLYRPGDLEDLTHSRGTAAPSYEVTGETTAQAARRLFESGIEDVAALNFASAKNPGGGFLGGARAQEEDLARASALYTCLCTKREYYDAHRASSSMLYTDRLIYSPRVPFFRDDGLALLETPFLVSILTSAAPNAGEALRRAPSCTAEIRAALHRRARTVLDVAAHRGHRVLVLGAWGCGVFRNDPRTVAGAFAHWLADARFAGAFERVVFAVYDRSAKRKNFEAFRERFGAG